MSTIEFPRAVNGTYAFSSLSNFLTGTYNNSGFTQTFGETSVALSNPNLGLFVQDEWRAGSHVTINAGVRYDLQFLETIDTDRNNVSPRLGVAWSPSDARRLVVRGSVGRFYDRVPLRALANALLSAGNTTDVTQLRQTSVSLSPTQTNAPVFPNILTAVVPTTTLVNFTTMDRQLQNAYSNQASLEVERQIGTATSVSVGYHRLRGEHLLMQINQNVPACAASGNNNGCRPIPTYANNGQYLGRREFGIRRPAPVGHAAPRFLGRVPRVLHLLEVDEQPWRDVLRRSTGPDGYLEGLGPIRRRPAASADGERHGDVAGATADGLVAGCDEGRAGLRHAAGTTRHCRSTSPQGPRRFRGPPARPLVDGEPIPRNDGEGSRFSSVSLRLSKQIALGGRASADVIVEGFNIFNTRNDLARITVFGTGPYPASPAPTFGQVTVVGDPRSFQVGFRVRY